MKRTNGRESNQTKPGAAQADEGSAYILLECPKQMKLDIKARAAALDLSVNQYLRQLARRDLGQAA